MFPCTYSSALAAVLAEARGFRLCNAIRHAMLQSVDKPNQIHHSLSSQRPSPARGGNAHALLRQSAPTATERRCAGTRAVAATRATPPAPPTHPHRATGTQMAPTALTPAAPYNLGLGLSPLAGIRKLAQHACALAGAQRTGSPVDPARSRGHQRGNTWTCLPP
ncbi:hypothetical protein GUJ93_ZPchr0006g41337 [Zizania palustris]|uniref:Uncharacterized protein n=1 Tax=Zizania palustris TaxID=103762 RepID=A0A8J5SBS3_ZIZPA|nr:hypothetical protein GUJ93_ZPchr0006g41337 [Zizania palustris]